MRNLPVVMEMFHIMTVEMVRKLHTFVKTKNGVNFTLVNNTIKIILKRGVKNIL